MFPLTAQGKEAMCVVVLMTSETPFTKRNMEGYCDNPYHLQLYPNTPKRVTA